MAADDIHAFLSRQTPTEKEKIDMAHHCRIIALGSLVDCPEFRPELDITDDEIYNGFVDKLTLDLCKAAKVPYLKAEEPTLDVMLCPA